MSRAEDAVMRLYEDAALREELTDEPANKALKWAEDQLIALDETAADDAAFEAGEQSILAALKQINTTVGHTLSAGGAMPETDAQAFSAQAADLGAAVNTEQVKDASTPDEMALVENLIALIDAKGEHAPETPVEAQAESVTDVPPKMAIQADPEAKDEPIAIAAEDYPPPAETPTRAQKEGKKLQSLAASKADPADTDQAESEPKPVKPGAKTGGFLQADSASLFSEQDSHADNTEEVDDDEKPSE